MVLPRVSHGQPLARSATRENAYTDAANDFMRRRDSALIAGKADRKIWDAGAVWVKNVSASNYDRYSVVGLRDPIFTDPAQAAFSQFTGFEVSSPSDPSAPFAIIQEPLPIGVAQRIGVTEGITPARVLINDPDHGYAAPVSGETGFLESNETGPAEILWKEATGETRWALVRLGIQGQSNYPGAANLVTEVCKIGDTRSLNFKAGNDYDISTADGQVVIAGEYEAVPGPIKVKVVINWKDSNYNASSGDAFGFYLKVGGVTYDGAPQFVVQFVANGATINKEMTWDVVFTAKTKAVLAVWAYRVSGSRSLTVDATSRIEVDGGEGGIRVEKTNFTFPAIIRGRKVCVDNPKNCCIEDQSSDTSSRDQSSKSPFPIRWSTGEIDCPVILGWRGTALDGPVGQSPIGVAERFKVILPGFAPSQGQLADEYGNDIPFDSREIDACDPLITAFMSGKELILTLAGDCVYYSPTFWLDLPSYTDPTGYTHAWKASVRAVMTMVPHPEIPITPDDFIPRHVDFRVLCFNTQWSGQENIIYRATSPVLSFFFDESVAMAQQTTRRGVLRNPQDWYNDPDRFLWTYHTTQAGIIGAGNVTAEPY